MRCSAPLLLACLLLGGPAGAREIQADRPGESDQPTIVLPGTLQFETGLKVSRETNESPRKTELTVPDLTLRYGLIPRLELRLDTDGFVYEQREDAANRASGADISLAFKLRLLDQQGLLPDFGVLVGLSFPTGSDAVSSDGYDPDGRLLASWSFAEAWNVTGNLGFSGPTQGADDPQRIFQLEPKLSIDRALPHRVSAFVEYFGALKSGGKKDEHSLDGGFAWIVHDNIQLDLSGGGGLDAAAPDWFVSAGFSWRFLRP
jgi:hypothetical protein